MNDSALLARLAVDALAAAGVSHVVLCPGSRSAPLAYALTARPGPDAVPALRVRHDERVAAFTALGVTRGAHAAGELAAGAVVTTSGTAAANLHPAVLEAHHADVPLVVVTADRPPALRGTWANQTSELQAGLFGDAVRARLDLADADAARDPDAAWAALMTTLAAAWGSPDGGRPGPVHLDLGFTDPLVPVGDADGDAVGDAHDERPGRDDEGPRRDPGAASRHRDTGRGGESLEPLDGTVVVAGDGAGGQARWLAEAGGWPLLAEPSSGARSGPNAIGPYRLLLELPELTDVVRRAVVLGRPTLSRPVSRLLARDDVELVLVSPYADRPDPGRPVRRIVGSAVPADLMDDAKGWYRRDPDPWLARWLAAGAAAQTALDALLDGVARRWGTPDVAPLGPLVAREVAAALGPGELLVAAASNPVRDLDLAGRPFEVPVGDRGALDAGHERVVANRGLAGIDGTLSTALGAALGRDGDHRVRVLVGDLAFLHDANALLADPAHPDRATGPQVQVIVLDDDGGGIFHLLEHGERAGRGRAEAAAFEQAFGTPHGADLGALCRGFGVPHTSVGSLPELRAALAAPAAGTSVVEVASPRAGLRDLHARIGSDVHAAARAALASTRRR